MQIQSDGLRKWGYVVLLNRLGNVILVCRSSHAHDVCFRYNLLMPLGETFFSVSLRALTPET